MKTNWHDKMNFGMHFDLHANKTDTELGAKITHENLKRALSIIDPDWIQCDCKGHPGMTAWETTFGTMAPGVIKDAMRVHADVCKELGIPLGMHYSGVWDTAAIAKHPDWEVLGPDGKVYGNAMNSVCPFSPYYDELMIPQMIELIDKYDVDGFWIDGDCWGVQLCYCDKCKSSFKEKYGIEAPVRETGEAFNWHVNNYKENTAEFDEDWYNWTEFHRQLFLANVQKYTDAVHARKETCLVISNWLYTYGCPIEETVTTDYISGDLSPVLGLKSAALEGHFLTSRIKDWDLMVWAFLNDSKDMTGWTAKNITHLNQECAYIAACGGAVMIYETPHRNGLLTDWHCEDYRKIGKFIKERAKISRHTESVPQIAVLHNPKDFFTEASESAFKIDINHPSHHKGTGAIQLLLENHYHFDIVMPSMLKGKYNDYELIIINDQYLFDAEFVKDIEDYVKAGGKVLISGVNATRTFSNLLGVEGKGLYEENFFVQSLDEVTAFRPLCRQVEVNTAKVFRYVMDQQIIDEDETSVPAITFNDFGKGKVAGVYFNIFSQYSNLLYPRVRDLVKEIIDGLDCNFMISDIVAPSYVHFILREKDNKIIVNLMNTGSVSSSLARPSMVEHVPTVSEIKFKIKLDKKPSYVEIAPSQININDCYKDGYLNITVNNLDVLESVVIYK